ncbi:related to ACT1-actin [Serendipita indica DSM 11827]|uniref:Related to ACT1-actin n=1 Tax=Serendipita indica (strain DSM 11827) TaxID=1109443 RepID=G4TDW1_SERID|nr:related to ACT1-actin [Serendipita indica DSM 11827]
MVVFGGDDVSALVLDIGAHTVRAGYAGDDAPKAVFSSSYGYRDEPSSEGDGSMTTRKVWVGHQGPALWKANQEVGSPFREGVLEDFTYVPNLINHAFNETLRCDPADHPVLVTEPAWNTEANRERMAEILFEEFKVPAFYIANSGVLTSFAAGQGTALVVDIGSYWSSVVPVVDGFVLRKGIQRSALSVLQHLSSNQILMKRGVRLISHQLIASKMPVPLDTPPKVTLREDRMSKTTESWSAWSNARELEEWRMAVGGVFDISYATQQGIPRAGKQYEFPDGFTSIFYQERFLPGECYFSQDALGNAPNLPPPLPHVLHSSLAACEPDLKAQLLQNIILTGGGSLLNGFPERLNNELNKMWPGKIKLIASGNQVERQYSAWIGGSILASLGTFHQLWISKAEYQEHGRSIVSQRCK